MDMTTSRGAGDAPSPYGGIARLARPFATLRVRLFLAFATVAGLALILAGAAVALVVRDYRTRIAVDHLSDLAIISSFTARQLELQSVSPEGIAAVLAGQVRGEAEAVLIVDPSGRVVADHRRADDDEGEEADDGPLRAARLTGRQIAIPAGAATVPAPPIIDVTIFGRRILFRPSPIAPGKRGWGPVGARARLGTMGPPVLIWESTAGTGVPLVMVTTDLSEGPPPDAEVPRSGPGRAVIAARAAAGARNAGQGASAGAGMDVARNLPGARYRVVLATPARDLHGAWSDLAPRLAVAGAIALAIALAAATTIAAWIGAGIRRISIAARQVAAGDLDARVPVTGHDEIADLGRTFNHMADEVHRSQAALRTFVADASHELRTPLTSIQGFAGALLDGALPGEEGAMRAGSIISEEAARMRAVVEDLLYLSKVEAMRTEPRRDPVALDEIAREAIRRLGHLAEARGQAINLSVARGPEVVGDPAQVDLLVTNLLENAIKYSPDGAAITVDVGTSPPPGPADAFVRVHNSGAAIPAADLPHVFDRFYRVDKSRSRHVDGSGLGLAIAREVARRHGGDIEVRSSEAEGTTFIARLAARPR